MTTQKKSVLPNGLLIIGSSDGGGLIPCGPSVVIPVDTINKLSDADLAKYVRAAIELAEESLASGISHEILLDRKIIKNFNDEYISSRIELLERFSNADIDIRQACELLKTERNNRLIAGIRKKTAKGKRQQIAGNYLKLWLMIGERDGFKCKRCGSYEDIGRLQIDHIIPLCHDGSNDPDNLQLLCSACNLSKGASLESKEA